MTRIVRMAIAALVLHMCGPVFAWGQTTPPWELFEDPQSASLCGVVNAENVQLVVLRDTRQLMAITGPDIVVEDTSVDPDGNVSLGEVAMGVIRFAEDGDGLRSLWWQSGTGRVVHIDGLTFTPSESDAFPREFRNVLCDPCDLWGNPDDCPPVPAMIVTAPQNQTACLGERVHFIAAVQGTDLDRIRWSKNGVTIEAATSPTLTIGSADLFDTATYTIDLLDVDGNVLDSANATLLVQECNSGPGLNLCGSSTGMVFPLVLLGLAGMGRWNRRFGV